MANEINRKDFIKPAYSAETEGKVRYGMVIDLKKCIKCDACTIACIAENHLPPGVVYNEVMEWEVGEYPNVRREYLPRPYMQCEKPPCVSVCPVNATSAIRKIPQPHFW